MALERILWLDGSIKPASEFHLEPTDELVLYGRGVFQTTRTFDSYPWLWDRHRAAILEAASQVRIPLLERDLPTESDVATFVQALGKSDVALRLNAGAVGPSGKARVWMFHRPLPVGPAALRLTTSPYLASRTDAMACFKSMNYLARHLSYETAFQQGFHDAILVDEDRLVLETAHGNIFAYWEGRWRTPPATGGMLAGTVRGWILEHAARGIVEEGPLSLDQVMKADALAVTNSVRGAVRVEAVNDHTYPPSTAIEELTKLLEQSRPGPVATG